ncbi:hypothetical protein Rhal01_02081 [Rubritalea halochordaticola]|uniref:FecR protein domain-containing protein n=1 Tax=Rubritalea halochordaticola TaxID=714537 RepID=A0ABP9UZV0_9BACT
MRGPKLEKAIMSYFDGTLDELECRQLQDTLKRDRAARDLYRQHAELQQSFLFRYSQATQAAKKRPSIAEIHHHQQQRRNVKMALGAAAAALIAIAISLQFIFVSPPTTIASLESSRGSQFSIQHHLQDGEDVNGAELAPGSTVELTQGTLEITLDKGVRSIILAPASFELIDEKRLYLYRGTAWFHVEKEAHGFQVITHQFTVTDLGTEFGVIAHPKESDQVHLFQGSVMVRTSTQSPDEETLSAGQARICTPKGQLSEIPSSTSSFLTKLPEESSQNLLINGNFELGNPPADKDWGEPANAALLPGWTWSPGITVASRSTNGKPGFGNGQRNIHSSTRDTQLAFNVNPRNRPDPADATIRQTFATVPGQRYTVSFEMGANLFSNTSLELFAAVYDGADHNSATGTLLGTHTQRRNAEDGSGYNPPTSFTFTAASTSATLVFTETSNNSESADLCLDNVSVNKSQ